MNFNNIQSYKGKLNKNVLHEARQALLGLPSTLNGAMLAESLQLLKESNKDINLENIIKQLEDFTPFPETPLIDLTLSLHATKEIPPQYFPETQICTHFGRENLLSVYQKTFMKVKR